MTNNDEQYGSERHDIPFARGMDEGDLPGLSR